MNFLTKVLNFSAERYLKTAGDLFIYEGDYESALHMLHHRCISRDYSKIALPSLTLVSYLSFNPVCR